MGSSPMGTFGKLIVQSEVFYTVERPWVDNKPFESCIPLGDYRLLWRPTTTAVPEEFDGHTWYLEGEHVGLYDGDKARSRCCLHIANTSDNVNGCIGPGLGLGALSQNWAVLSSRPALLKLLQLVGPQDAELSINNTLMG